MLNSNGYEKRKRRESSLININLINPKTTYSASAKKDAINIYKQDLSFQKNKTLETSTDRMRNCNLSLREQNFPSSPEKKKKKKMTKHLIITAKNKRKKKKKKKNRANSAKEEKEFKGEEYYYKKQKEKMKGIAGLIVIKKLSQSYFMKNETMKVPKMKLELSLIKEKPNKKIGKSNKENAQKNQVEHNINVVNVDKKSKNEIQSLFSNINKEKSTSSKDFSNNNNNSNNQNNILSKNQIYRKNRFFPIRQSYHTKIDSKTGTLLKINKDTNKEQEKPKIQKQKLKIKPKSAKCLKHNYNITFQVVETVIIIKHHTKSFPLTNRNKIKLNISNFQVKKLQTEKTSPLFQNPSQKKFQTTVSSPLNNSSKNMSSSTVLVKNIKIRPTNTTNSSTFRYEPKTLQQIQEEKTQRIVQIRKDFNQRQSQNIKDLKSHFYIILPGNASYLVKNCMQHRINWKEPFSVTTSLYNFKWQQISYGIDFASLSKFSSFKQIVNHYENHYFISNKANLFTNLFTFCEERGLSIFKYVPFTIIHKIEKDEQANKEKNEHLHSFIDSLQKYIKPYNEIGSYLNNTNSNEAVQNAEEQIEDSYYEQFHNIVIPKEKDKKEKEKEKEKEKQEEVIIGKKTKIEIPSTHWIGKNIWVVKAVNLNRGQCIKVVNTFEKMEKVINKIKVGIERDAAEEITEENPNNKKEENASKEEAAKEQSKEPEKPLTKEEKEERKKSLYQSNKIIIQKYIENPLLYKGRKCDMRIWVLVTHKMKVYVFKEGHLKTCSVDYDINSKDAYTHITNYSFQKHCANFQKFEKGNEVPFYDFQAFLDDKFKDKHYSVKNDLMKQIKEIIEVTMKCAKYQLNANKRKYSFEIFGYDFMLDADFNLFLIEINTNPGLEESSPWIKTIVPRMLDDALRLTIDVLFDTKYDHSLNYKDENKEKDYRNTIIEEEKNSPIDDTKSIANASTNQTSNSNTNNFTNAIITTKQVEPQSKKEEENTNTKPISSNNEEKKQQEENKKYISPFPVPGYENDENLWDFICDLTEKDSFELAQEQKKETTYTGIKHLIKRKKQKAKAKS